MSNRAIVVFFPPKQSPAYLFGVHQPSLLPRSNFSCLNYPRETGYLQPSRVLVSLKWSIVHSPGRAPHCVSQLLNKHLSTLSKPSWVVVSADNKGDPELNDNSLTEITNSHREWTRKRKCIYHLYCPPRSSRVGS